MADLTAREIFDNILPDRLESNEEVEDIDSIYQFNIDDDTWSIDFTKDSDFVSEGASDDSDVEIDVSEDDFLGMWTGEKSGQQLFMMGKISVDGDMSLALKLQKFIG
jgi:putative sterol carrier protein